MMQSQTENQALSEKREKPVSYSTPLDQLSESAQTAYVIRLWERMREIYGMQWTREYGSVDGQAFKTWRSALLLLNGDQIAKGLTEAAKSEREFPPNLPTFRAMCKVGAPEPKPENRPYLEAPKPTPEMTARGVQVVQEAIKQAEGMERDQKWLDDYNKLCRSRWGAYTG